MNPSNSGAPDRFTPDDSSRMRLALRLARRAYGETSPNPMVGAVLVNRGGIIGQGWHRRAGEPHAEVEAIRDAGRQGHTTRGATLYVTLEPCCTTGRTPPCTEAITAAGIKRVIVAATDPNPSHAGKGFAILESCGIEVRHGLLADEAARMNEAFNHWIVHRTPLVTVKAAMTLDGKIAAASGESKWITGDKARAVGMRLRRGADAILVGINTVLADDPQLTLRGARRGRPLRRVVLDSMAATPLTAKVASDEQAALTTIVATDKAPLRRVKALSKQAGVWIAPTAQGKIDLRWLLEKLGAEGVTSLLVEGGGEANAAFLSQGLAHRVVFFYAPKILGGAESRKGVAGEGARDWQKVVELDEARWRLVGVDLLLTAKVRPFSGEA